MTSTFGSRNKITDLGDRKKIVDLGRGKIYLGEGKAKVFLTKEEIGDLCYSFLLMADSKELCHKTEPLFDLLSEVEEDLKWGSNGRGVLKLENGRLTLGYKNHYEDITEIAKEEGFSFWHYIHALGLERTGLAGGESPCEFRDEKPEKVSLGKKLGALGIIGLITGVAGGLGIYYSLSKGYDDTKNTPVKLKKKDKIPKLENNSTSKKFITLKELATKNDPEEIKKYTWPLFCEDISGSTHISRDEYFLFLPQNNEYVRIQFKNESSTENFIKGMDAAGIPYKTITYADLCEKINVPPQLFSLFNFTKSDDPEKIHSVLVPADDFFQHKQELIALLNKTSGISKNDVVEDINKLELGKIANSVTPMIVDFKEINVENAVPPFGDALKLQKRLWNFTDRDYDAKISYLVEFENALYNETDFDALVKSKLKEEGYTIEDLNNMSIKDVLKVLAKLVEDNVEYDEAKAEIIVKAIESGKNDPSARYYTPYETLTKGRGVCSDYAFTYEGVERILKDDIPKLKRIMVVGNRGGRHEWNNIIYFNGTDLSIIPIDLTWDDADGIPLGSKNNNTLSDFSAIDNYHCFSKK